MNKNWEYYKLSDVCSIHGRIGWQGLTRKEHKTSGDYLLITGTDFTEDNKINLKTCVYVDEYRYTQDENIQIRKDDLLITKDGTLGKLALISEELPKPATLNGGIFVLRDKTKKLYPRFLLNYMKSDEFRKIIHNNRTGSTVPHLTQNMLVNFPIPIPPLEEQKRIVAVLDKKFAQIETLKIAAEKNLQNTKQLFQAELEKAFSNTSWERVLLSEIALDFSRGKSKHRPRNDKILFGGDYPFIQTGDIRNSDKYVTEYTETYNETGLAQSKLWPEGTLCITIAANIAETAILTFPCCFPDSIIGFIPNEKRTTVDYIYYVIQFFKAELQKLSKGAAQDNLNLSKLESMKFPLPPLEEQKRIVVHLDSLSEKVHQLEEIYTKQLVDCDELKQSFLQKAFAGEL